MEILIKKLKTILKDELNIYNIIKELSDKKKDIIISRKVSELDKITQIEQELILKLGQLEKLREKTINEILKELKINSDITISSILENINSKEKKELESIKNNLLSTLNEIKKKNELNNMLIRDSLEYINFNLNLITNTSNDVTYSKDINSDKNKQSVNLFDIKA